MLHSKIKNNNNTVILLCNAPILGKTSKYNSFMYS